MIKGAVPKGWHLKPPPRYGAESANTSYSPVHTAKATLSGAFGVATCINPHKEKEPGTQIASRLSLVAKVVSLDRLELEPLIQAKKRVWNTNCVQTQSDSKERRFGAGAIY